MPFLLCYRANVCPSTVWLTVWMKMWNPAGRTFGEHENICVGQLHITVTNYLSNLKRGTIGFGLIISQVFYWPFCCCGCCWFCFYSYRKGEPVVEQDCWAHGSWEGKGKAGRKESEVPVYLQGADPSHSKVSHVSFCSPLAVLEITVSIRLALNP